ncbi:MAG: hypothetical protein V1900_01135 [Candidatus Aenigmatarchaeota archaeon]
MDKIQKFVAEKKILPSQCLYHTNRSSKNKKGEITGQTRVLVLKSDNLARVEYVCPECKHCGYIEQEWKRPFSTKCEKCGAKISVPKMKDEAKREMKKS